MPRKPAVIVSSIHPKGRRSGESEGTTRIKFRIHTPMRPSSETVPKIPGVRLGRTPSRTRNGIAHIRIGVDQDKSVHGACQKRCTMKNVSVGISPYQITKYWANPVYIQKIEKANIILPISCSTPGAEADVAGPNARRNPTAINPIVTIALQKSVAKYHQPNKVLCHLGDSDMIK